MSTSRFATMFAVQAHPSRLLISMAFLATVLIATAQAQTQQPPSSADGRIVVIGEGNISVPPDYAQIRSGVTTRAKTAKEADDANSKAMSTVTAVLLTLGLSKRTSRHRNSQSNRFTRRRSPGPSQNSPVTASPTRSS